MLEITDLTKIYTQGKSRITVLDHLNFKLAPGETVAILGPSGSGKSTLINLIAGLDHPSSGQIKMFGEDLNLKTEEELTALRARHIGIVFQQYHLLPYLNALDNVTLPLELQDWNRKEALAQARALLNIVGLSEREPHFPHQLSGGECQRVAIARALVTNPKLLIADEPSGSLDNATGETVMNYLFQSVEHTKSALLLVTHNQQLAKRCHRTVYLAQGQLHT